MRDAVKAGRIPAAQVDASVERILRAKARAGLHRNKLVNLDAIANVVGTRRNQAVADEVSQRSITLVEDERNQVPLKARARRAGPLSVGARLSVRLAHRGAEPDVHSRAAEALAERDRRSSCRIERRRRRSSWCARWRRASTRSSRRCSCAPPRPAGAWICAEPLQRLLDTASTAARRPFVTVFFGNPYVATFMPELPAVLLTYDFYDRAEASAVRALAG